MAPLTGSAPIVASPCTTFHAALLAVTEGAAEHDPNEAACGRPP
jgi:hypothetical protein